MTISAETLRVAHQALAALPATNARQAVVLARCLMELEEALAAADRGAVTETGADAEEVDDAALGLERTGVGRA